MESHIIQGGAWIVEFRILMFKDTRILSTITYSIALTGSHTLFPRILCFATACRLIF